MGKHPDQRAEVLEGKDASVFYGLHEREQAYEQEAFPERAVDIAQAAERAHKVVPVDDLLLGFLPGSPVMDGTGGGDNAHLVPVIPRPVSPVVVVSVDREERVEQADLLQRLPRHQPVGGHDPGHRQRGGIPS